MTTIAANKDMMACDSQTTCDDGMIIGTKQTKIHWVGKHGIVGIAGDADAEKQILDYFRKDKKLKLEESEFKILQLTTEGKIFRYDSSMDGYEVDCPMAIGSGGPYALAAMKNGKTPRQAVNTASECDAYTGGKIWSLKRAKST